MIRMLSKGMHGHDVVELQDDLWGAGVSTSVSGVYDAKTQAAVAEFQRAHGLVADGIAGRNTQARLAAVLADGLSGEVACMVDNVELPHHFESCTLTAYVCPAGHWTNGWGETSGVAAGDVWTQEYADQRFLERTKSFSADLNRLITVPLEQHQFDALFSFVYNIGARQFGTSTLRRKLNAGDTQGAAAEFLRWNKGGGKELAGLTRRRKSEQHLFLTGEIDFFE